MKVIPKRSFLLEVDEYGGNRKYAKKGILIDVPESVAKEFFSDFEFANPKDRDSLLKKNR